jgi:cell wall-associated NlpC family hydrolase
VTGADAAHTSADHAQPIITSAVPRTPVILVVDVTVGTPGARKRYTSGVTGATAVPEKSLARRSAPGGDFLDSLATAAEKWVGPLAHPPGISPRRWVKLRGNGARDGPGGCATIWG